MELSLLLVIASALVLLCILIARVSDNSGLPALVLFLGVGMLAGSEGPGGIYFDNAAWAQRGGIVCLICILFSGGLDTSWPATRPVLGRGLLLATVGVAMTAGMVGLLASTLLGVDPLLGLLLGAIISSTDAAAVFSVLRSRSVHLREPIRPLLEFESGSNDPMAVFLTLGLTMVIMDPARTAADLLWMFVRQMALGGVLGYLAGRLLAALLNRLRISAEGLYAVLALALCFLAYGVTDLLGGSGFLAVYLAGMTAGNRAVAQRRTILRFFDGLAWLSQITMFVVLGLLVFPSQLVPVAGAALLISLGLMLVARPLAVLLLLLPWRLPWRESAFISWVGLRGAVPIILATFPLLSGVPHADIIFNVVFFIVLTSALVQGWSIPVVARVLGVASDDHGQPVMSELTMRDTGDTQLLDLRVAPASHAAGSSIVELGLPGGCLVVLIEREGRFIIPGGSTVLESGDSVRILTARDRVDDVRALLR